MAPSDETSPVDEKGWIEAAIGGHVTRIERVAAGASRATWLVDVLADDGSARELVLRRDTGDGPLSGTELSLERESAVYEALADTDVAIPRLVARAPDGRALLIERASGRNDLAALTDVAARTVVLHDYVRALATLHAVDPSGLVLPGFAQPVSGPQHATAELALWQRIFEDHVERPAPLARFAFSWLRRHAPASVTRTVLCHGDAGPGNFLFEDGRVTALLDWEFAHLGDPVDDLAWLTVRGFQVLDDDALRACLDLYTELTGTPVESNRLQYYRALVLLRMLVACLVGLQRRTGATDVSTYFNLVPFVSCQLARVLGGLAGVALEPPPAPVPIPEPPEDELVSVLVEDMVNVILPAITDPSAAVHAKGIVSLLVHLQAAQRSRRPVARADLDDLESTLAVRPPSVVQGLRALDARVAAAAPNHDAELLTVLARIAEREVYLWPLVAAAVTVHRFDPIGPR